MIVRAQRQISLNQLPGVRKRAAETAASMGAGVEMARAGIGDAIADTGRTIAALGVAEHGRVVEAERERADSVAILAAENRLSEWESKRLYDPQTGALTRKGKDALGLPEEVAGEFSKVTGEIEATLSTDRQRAAFARLKSNRGTSLDLNLRRHVFGEMERYEADELESAMLNFSNSAISNANDPKAVQQNLSSAVAAVETHGKNLGWSKSKIENQVAKVQSNVHTGVVERLLATEQDGAAKAYFDAANEAGQISGDQLARLEKALEEGTLRGESTRRAESIVSKGGTFAEQMEEVNKIKDPKVKDATRDRIKEFAAIKDRADRDEHEALTTKGKNLIDKTGSWRSIPANEWAKLTVQEAAALKSYAEHKVAQTPIKTVEQVRYSLSQMATSPDPEVRRQFQQTNLMRYVNQLSSGDFQQLTDAQNRGRADDADKAYNLLVNVTQQNQMVDDALVSMGLDPKPPDPGTKGFDQQIVYRVNEFRRSVREAVQRKEVEQGKKATDDQVQSIVDRLRTPTGQKMKSDGWFWDTYDQAFAFETSQAQAAKVTDIPQAEREKITTALRARNLQVTDTAILNLFNELLAQTRKDR